MRGEREGDRDRLAAVSDLALVREARSCERPQEKQAREPDGGSTIPTRFCRTVSPTSGALFLA